MKRMNRKAFFAALEKNNKKGLELIKSKNHDYAGVKNPFRNFRACKVIGLSPEQGILLRMLDKMTRAGNLLKVEQKVKDESIEDTILDLMNYANILLVYRQNQRKK